MFDLTDSNDPIDQHLIDLFNAARADATTEELAAEGNIVLAMQQAMTPVPSNVITFRSNSMRQRFATSKAATKAAIISGVVLFSATAAAAGGVLPDSAQSAVSRAVSHIGIDISNPEKSADDNSALASDDTATDNSVDDNSTDNSFDDSASRVSKVNHDLCEDLGTTSSTDDSTTSSTDASATPSQSLDDAAAAAGMTVTEFCASVDDDSSNGVGDDSGDDVGDDKGGLIGGHGSDDAVTSSSIDDSSDDDSDDSTQSTVAQVTIPGQNIAPSTSVADDSGSNSGKNSGKNKGGTSTDSRG